MAEVPSQAPKNKFEVTAGQKLIAGSVIASALLGYAGFKEAQDEELGFAKSLVASSGVTPEANPSSQQNPNTQTPPEFVNGLKSSYTTTAAYKLIDSYPAYDTDVDEVRAVVLSGKDNVTPWQMQQLNQPRPTSLENATSQQVENEITLHTRAVSSQTETEKVNGQTVSGKEVALQEVDFYLDPRNPHNAKIKSLISDGQQGLLDVSQALSNYPRKQNFTFMHDVVTDGWVIEEKDYIGQETVSVIERIVTPGGKEEPVLRDSYPLNDSQVQSEIQRLFGNK